MGERRQVTVLFADLSGFTRLSSVLDPEETHGLLNSYFEVIDHIVVSYGGSIDKHIGDCVMAVFGAPTAHSDDSERAVRAALAIHPAMQSLSEKAGRTLKVHVGLASGQVVASKTGSGERQEYTVTGDTVNLASRLTAQAGPGETFTSNAVYQSLLDRLDGEDVGAISIKGLDRPVPVWRVRGLRSSGSHRIHRRLVGRQGELGQFSGIVASCREAGSGLALYVRGEAGIGKTRLVEEFQRIASSQNFACHLGLVLDFGVGKGQDAIRAIVRSCLECSGQAETAARAAAKRALSEELLDSDQLVYLNDLLDLPQPTELRALYNAMDNAARNRGKQKTVAQLLRRLSARSSQMVTIEDLHWADPVTLAHAAELTMLTALCPFVLVMTSRTEGDQLDPMWRSRTRAAPLITIDLGPLREQDALALAGEYSDASKVFALACVKRSEGHPLFLEQLLRSGVDSDLDSIPGSIQSLVQARMDALEPTDKQALQAASVLGQRFSLDVLRHLVNNDQYVCTRFIEQDLVRSDGNDFLFSHALVQEAIYSSLLTTNRRELHRQAAACFAESDPVLRAAHLDRAADPAAPQAYLWAARSQAAAYHNERALRLVERGHALAIERADIYAVTHFRGELLHDLGAIPEARQAFERALEVAGDDVESCRAWIGLATVMRISDQMQDALQALDRAQALATAEDLIVELSRIHHLRGNLYFPLGRIEGCVEQHELALRYARQAGSAECEAQALGGLGDAAYVRGRMLTAHRNFDLCVAVSRQHGFGRIEVANLNMAALTRQYANELPAAAEDALAAAEAAVRVGHQRAELLARNIAAFALYDMAELQRARDQLLEAGKLIERIGARRFVPENLTYLAKIMRAEGQRLEASHLLDEALAVSRETGLLFFGPRILAERALAAEDPAEQRKALREGESILGEGCVGHNHLWFYRDAIETALGGRDWSAVDRYAASLAAFTEPEPLPWSNFFIARGRALADIGRGRCGDSILAELRRLQSQAGQAGHKLSVATIEQAMSTG
ncbi:AAA family ATPase [Bradyrhizobium manausense]|uniref:adenylate/guanylate cyclase domain-containing protein n=1 Tax=Bradyrhizobium TaxID=374 RepID=UPI001BA6D50B|nr:MULTISPECIES: adenylate/guanylate cyclase domain-containing protein [Bradyrhizobium]MBR0827221.1 AAA family ATPase [Bradyrhizobium manausense]UVO27118.1 AAA family ATPase [Bradyrhizobium arachidis]